MSTVTIKDIAREAGCSISTVSKAINNYPNIPEETKQKIFQVMKELGYIPNKAASTLSSKKNEKIALYLYINDRFQQIDEINMLYILGAFDKAKELELETTTVFNYSIENLQKEDLQAYFKSLSVDVIVVFGLNKDDEKIHYLMNNSDFKFVVVDADITNKNTSSVMIDHTLGQYETAKQLIDENDKVLYLAGKSNGYVTDMRLKGIKKLKKEVPMELTIKNADFSENRAYEIAKETGWQYDAIVCASDLMAVGAKRALNEIGHFAKLSGFDGIRLMGYVGEDILTCKQNFYEIGTKAVEEASHLHAGKKGESVTLPFQIGKISYQSIIR